MITFTEQPTFFCRKCFTSFTPDPVNPVCPACDHAEKHGKNVTNFFKFYPRLLAAIPAMDKNGFKWIRYEISKHPMINQYWIGGLVVECCKCGCHNKISETRSIKLSKEPGLLCCRGCKVHPALNKVTKEFFVSLNNVDKSALGFVSFQWDLFSPSGFEPAARDVLFGASRTEY